MLENEGLLPQLCLKSIWKKMNMQEKIQVINRIKSKVAVTMIQALQYMEANKFDKAKQLFIYIADICNSVSEPDSQIEKWKQIACTNITKLFLNQQKEQKLLNKIRNNCSSHHPNILTLRYNKFSNQFQLQEQQEGYDYKEILQQVIKINSILFENQNINGHSLLVMLSLYWFPISYTFLAILFGLILLSIQQFFNVLISKIQQLWVYAPPTFLFISFLIPMLFIFIITPQQRDNIFFQKKLGKKLKQINESCKVRKKQIVFMSPQSGQLNLVLGAQTLKRLTGQKHQQNNQCQNEISEDEQIY